MKNFVSVFKRVFLFVYPTLVKHVNSFDSSGQVGLNCGENVDFWGPVA